MNAPPTWAPVSPPKPTGSCRQRRVVSVGDNLSPTSFLPWQAALSACSNTFKESNIRNHDGSGISIPIADTCHFCGKYQKRNSRNSSNQTNTVTFGMMMAHLFMGNRGIYASKQKIDRKLTTLNEYTITNPPSYLLAPAYGVCHGSGDRTRAPRRAEHRPVRME